MATGIGKYAGMTTVIAALAATAVVALADPAQQPASTAATGEMALTDDDGGQPLFSVPEIKPGATVQRCITLHYSGESASKAGVTTGVSGELAKQLEVTVDRGKGGGFENCDGFDGTQIYQ